jgi:hypothetical protein
MHPNVVVFKGTNATKNSGIRNTSTIFRSSVNISQLDGVMVLVSGKYYIIKYSITVHPKRPPELKSVRNVATLFFFGVYKVHSREVKAFLLKTFFSSSKLDL